MLETRFHVVTTHAVKEPSHATQVDYQWVWSFGNIIDICSRILSVHCIGKQNTLFNKICRIFRKVNIWKGIKNSERRLGISYSNEVQAFLFSSLGPLLIGYIQKFPFVWDWVGRGVREYTHIREMCQNKKEILPAMENVLATR